MTDHHAQSYAQGHDDMEKPVEILKYALQCHGADYGAITARNQFVKLIINPLMDSVMESLKLDHVIGSETRYTVKLIIESERAIEMQ